MPAESGKPAKNRAAKNRKVVIAGAGALVVVAIGAVLVVPKLSGGGGSSDPGCTAYAGTALTAYDKVIGGLNAHASQTSLESDIAATTTDLTAAASQAKQQAVHSSLEALLTQLGTLKVNVEADSVPASTITALNAAATAADNAC